MRLNRSRMLESSWGGKRLMSNSLTANNELSNWYLHFLFDLEDVFFYLQHVFVVSNWIVSFQVTFIWNINLRKQKPSLNWLHQRSIALWKCFWRCTKRAAWYRYGRPESLKHWYKHKLRNLRKLKDILWVYPSPMMPKELLILNPFWVVGLFIFPYPPLETGMHSTYQERLGFDWIYDFMTSFNLFILEKANYWSVNFHSWDSWRVLVPTLGMHVDWVSWPTDKRLR